MPTTRSQAAEDRMRVYEDPPASPSAHTSADRAVNVTAIATETATAIATETATETLPRSTLIHTTVIDARARGSRAPSVRSHRSTASAIARIRQAELEAEEQLVEIRRQELQLQTALIKKRLAADVATIREETDRESLCAEEAVDTNRRVSDWLQGTQAPMNCEPVKEISPPLRVEQGEVRAPHPPVTQGHVTEERAVRQRPRTPTPDRGQDKIDRLVNAMERITGSRSSPRHVQDLPVFSGAFTEWLPFKAAMRESTSLYKYSPMENMTRLRTCLKGDAKQAVSSLLFTESDPEIIMRTLEQCYGRPELIMNSALEDLKRLPRLGTAASEINNFAIKVQNIVTVIKTIDKRGMIHNPMLAQQVTDRMSPYMVARWCDYAKECVNQPEPEIIQLSRFLMAEADSTLKYAFSSSTGAVQIRNHAANNKQEHLPKRANERYRSAKVYSTIEEKPKSVSCYCCGEAHRTSRCKKLSDMSVKDRWEWAKETHICYLCLDVKHRRDKCKAKKCGIEECRKPHHALLHYTPRKEDVVIAASAHRLGNNEKVLLKVCPIHIKKQDGGTVKTYALLDEGSTITLIDEEIARMVGAQGPTRALNIQGVTSTQREADSQEVEIKIQGKGQTNDYEIRARTVRNLTLGSQSVKPELLRRSYLKELCSENMCYKNAKPRVLIGADNWHLIVTRRLLSRRHNEPAASLTRLGWVLHGKMPRSSIVTQEENRVLHIRTYPENVGERDAELDALVRAHFDIDALGISKIRKPNALEERAKNIFEETVRRVNGRFEVGLPWATDDVVMPPSYDMAVRRLRTIEKKMDASPEFKTAYSAQVDGLVAKGYATKCDSSHREEKLTWYLPHFAVTNPNKPGKVRMVFDAAARVNGKCLNDMLLDGPDLLRSLQGVLFRFREKKIAITADIREMFLQVKIRQEDRAAQHFLWRGNDRSKPPEKYVMTSMIFGARSSPYIAHSVRNRNAEEHSDTHPLAYRAITRAHYMDDWVDSYDNMEEASRAVQEVQEVHRRAGFELAGWSSNRAELLSDIPSESQTQTPKELGANANQFGKTLGVLWLSRTDELAFNTARHRVPVEVKRDERTPTKRETLSAVMSIFDPLGLISPYTITAKIMLQGLWRESVGWDDPLPTDEATVFSEWQSDLRYIDELRLPRVYNTCHSINRQLHVFCDASEQAYAAAAYWRFVNDDRSVNVTLVAGKAKVAPMKAQSIPRMELQASLIGARLASEILNEYDGKPEVVYWSDSKTVLHWIRNDSSRYTPYVAHRLGEIAELTESRQWRWVPTAQNVADDATRSGNTRLKSDDRWFVGPAFLYEAEDRWPIEVSERLEAVEEQAFVAHTTIHETSWLRFQRFSSYERARRTIAYVLAFIDKCRKRATEMDVSHLKRADIILIREAQKESFPSEMNRLSNGNNVDRTSRLYKLDPMYGADGIIRLNGRIRAAIVPTSMKEPPVLDGTHHLTELLIRSEHANNHHVGREHVVNSLRQRYWVIRLRPAVKKALRKCNLCKLRKVSPVTPVKGNLPGARLSAYTRPFSRSGIDCFGPMTVTIGRRREKRWGMLITCLVTRAIHIEIVASLSTDSAIMALRRMAARRGWPELIWSDNGTNFRGSDVELRNAYNEWLPSLKDYARSKNSEWKFIDPGAPNQGGAWERLIRSVKTALAVTLNERAPREEILSTALTEIEHTINSRPLTHVSVEHCEAEALTPNHFLIGSAIGVPHVGECNAADKRTWRASQALANMFWTRWIREYLPTLTPRGDVRPQNIERIKVGDVVVIADGLLPRNVWPKGQVEKIYEGSDGVIRSADVRTRGGIFRRPAKRLIVLPID